MNIIYFVVGVLVVASSAFTIYLLITKDKLADKDYITISSPLIIAAITLAVTVISSTANFSVSEIIKRNSVI